MTMVFQGARDLLEITEAVTEATLRRRNWRRIALRLADASIVAGIFALAIAGWVATP